MTSATQDQTRTDSKYPHFGSPLPQACQSIHQQTSQLALPQTSQVPQSQTS